MARNMRRNDPSAASPRLGDRPRVVSLTSVAKGTLLADDEGKRALTEGAPPSPPLSAVQRMPAHAPLRGSEPHDVDQRVLAATVPNGAVLYGKFRVIGTRGRSGDELAFKALHLGTGRRVELRVLAEGVPAQSPEAERMLRSARAAGRAPHSNVLNIVDSGLDTEQRPFVVYEQFGGVPCTDLVTRGGPCELRVAAEIVGQVLDGLSALHGRGVYHRQVRPENVLVDGTADELRVKLVGLGYSLVSGREAAAPELPRGYSRYLAPEARRGEAVATPAVDIYAVGVLLRYLLTGLDHGEGELPAAVERALARALAEDPDERFQSAEQFRACVSAIAGPSTRESMVPSGSLQSDLRFMLRRREAAREEGSYAGDAYEARSDGRLEHFPVLLIIESLYARIGALGWSALTQGLPELERLLPAAGLAAQYREQGVPAALVEAMLREADAFSGKGTLQLVAELGEELARRGVRRFCNALPVQLTPEGLVACVPVLWRSVVRDGEVVTLESNGGSGRLSVREQLQPSLELSALFAGILRGQLQLLAPHGEVNLAASQVLGDGADLYVLGW
ncbi:MAG: Serine/threonine protein kinase [Myxococcaceae bacterium]|nr:Serine/threonine protein kinase [Myxococcaceae bacterium]